MDLEADVPSTAPSRQVVKSTESKRNGGSRVKWNAALHSSSEGEEQETLVIKPRNRKLGNSIIGGSSSAIKGSRTAAGLEVGPLVSSAAKKTPVKKWSILMDDLDNDIDEEDLTPITVLKKPKQRISSLPKDSMLDEEMQEDDYKMAQAHDSSQQPSYSAAELQALKAASTRQSSLPTRISEFENDDAFMMDMVEEVGNSASADFATQVNERSGTAIPDAEAIKRAKSLREAKKNESSLLAHSFRDSADQEEENETDDADEDFLPLNVIKPRPRGSAPRLVSQDEYDDGNVVEISQAYTKNRLAFGLAVSNEDGHDFDEDEDANMIVIASGQDQPSSLKEDEEWVQQQIRKGTLSREPLQRKKRTPLRIPELPLLPSLPLVLARMQSTKKEMISAIQSQKSSFDTMKEQVAKFEAAEPQRQVELDSASERYIFFQDLKEFVFALDQFLLVKKPLLEKAQQTILSFLDTQLPTLSDPSLSIESDIWPSTVPGLDLFWESFDSAILSAIRPIQEDALDTYFDAELVLDRFIRWNEDYPKEYNQSYSNLCISGLMEFYVSLELLSWTPLQKYTSLEEMRWHQMLIPFEDPDIHKSIVMKTVIPLLQKHISFLSLAHSNSTAYALKLLGDLLDYMERGDQAFQDLVSLIEKQLRSSIAAIYSTKLPSINVQITVLINTSEWKAYCPKMCVAFLWDLGLPSALQFFRSGNASLVDESLIDKLPMLVPLIPKEFPRDLLMSSFEPYFCQPCASGSFYQKAIQVCVALDCFALASKISSFLLPL